MSRLSFPKARNRRLDMIKGMIAHSIGQGLFEKARGKKKKKIEEAFLASLDIAEWAREFFPHLLINQDTGKPVPFADVHHECFAAVLVHMRILAVLPRGYAKSVLFSLIIPIYLAVHKMKRFLMFGSYDRNMAKDLLRQAKEELESNDAIREKYGDLVPYMGDTWRGEDIILTSGVRMKAFYFGMHLRGKREGGIRPDYIVIDDPQTKEVASNPDRVEEMVDWIFGEVFKLAGAATCTIVFAGTILSEFCVITKLIERAAEQAERIANGETELIPVQIHVIKREACDDKFENILWPEYFTRPMLRSIAAEDWVTFLREYRHICVDPADRAFHTFHGYTPDEINPDWHFPHVIGCDPATGKGKDRSKKAARKLSDFAYTTLARSPRGKRYVRKSYATNKDDPTMQRDELCHEYNLRFKQCGSVKIAVEAVAYQVALKAMIEEKARLTGTWYDVDDVQAKGDKDDRIRSIAPPVNEGFILFDLTDPEQRELINQLKYLGHWPKNDRADSLEIADREFRMNPMGKIEVENVGERETNEFREVY